MATEERVDGPGKGATEYFNGNAEDGGMSVSDSEGSSKDGDLGSFSPESAGNCKVA